MLPPRSPMSASDAPSTLYGRWCDGCRASGSPLVRIMDLVMRRGARLILVLALAMVLALVVVSGAVDPRGGVPAIVEAPQENTVDSDEAALSAFAPGGSVRWQPSDGTEPGPAVRATHGEPWPIVQRRVRYKGYLVLRPSTFKFKTTVKNCTILKEAFKRYQRLLNDLLLQRWKKVSVPRTVEGNGKFWLKDKLFHGYLDALEVLVDRECEHLPHLGMDEHYELDIDIPGQKGIGMLRSRSIWGALRGLETFVQLLKPDPSGTVYTINSTAIEDFPRFSHRGLLVDTSRHFLPVSTLLETLSAMEINKLNVFHWHIVDDQSFPYESKVFPSLSEKGAYHPSMVYTHNDIKKIMEYAHLRGIRVIPEFDTPGHTRSWGQGLPGLLTPCYSGDQPDGTYGPINPIVKRTFDILQILFQEIVEVFPDKYFHLGGDEVSFSCWASNPQVVKFMKDHGMGENFHLLENMYIQTIVQLTNSLNLSSIVWQEVFDNGVQIPLDTVVHVWIGDEAIELGKVTNAGYRALLSSCWYLDHLSSGGDWHKFYECDPHDFIGTDEQKQLVIGGEACMWGESVDDTNIHSRVWPRASATAEKLWSAKNQHNIDEAAHRLEEHTCRMKIRGIPAQPPNGPGFCVL